MPDHIRNVWQLVAACFILASCSGPSLSAPILLTTTTASYGGLPETIPFAQHAYVGSLALPTAIVVPQGDALTLVTSQVPFTTPPALQALNRRLAESAANNIPLIYFELSASATTVLSTLPSFSVNLPADIHPSNGPFYVAFYDPTAATPAWNLTFEGPGAVSGSMVTFAALNASAFTLQAGVKYYFSIYQRAGVPATAAPTPIPTSTPMPPGSLGLTSGTVSISGAGTGYAQQTVLQESGYVGTFSEKDSCSQIASIALSSNLGPSSTITVTGLASGICKASFQDAFGREADLSITVTVSGFNIS